MPLRVATIRATPPVSAAPPLGVAAVEPVAAADTATAPATPSAVERIPIAAPSVSSREFALPEGEMISRNIPPVMLRAESWVSSSISSGAALHCGMGYGSAESIPW